MSKSTRKNKNISSIITYQQRDVVKSLTVSGASDLMDLSDDKGHATLILNRDSTKLNVTTFTAYKKETKATLDDLQGQISYNFNHSKEQVEKLETKILELEKNLTDFIAYSNKQLNDKTKEIDDKLTNFMISQNTKNNNFEKRISELQSK